MRYTCVPCGPSMGPQTSPQKVCTPLLHSEHSLPGSPAAVHAAPGCGQRQLLAWLQHGYHRRSACLPGPSFLLLLFLRATGARPSGKCSIATSGSEWPTAIPRLYENSLLRFWPWCRNFCGQDCSQAVQNTIKKSLQG